MSHSCCLLLPVDLVSWLEVLITGWRDGGSAGRRRAKRKTKKKKKKNERKDGGGGGALTY